MRSGFIFRTLICIAVFALAGAPRAHACRYSVRDVGFVDLRARPYHLYAWKGAGIDAALAAETDRVFRAQLAESNVRFRMIDLETEKDPAVLKLAPPGASEAVRPAMTLAAPDGRSLSLADAAGEVTGDLARRSEAVITSPLREEIRDRLIDAYAAIVLVRGEDEEANRAARSAVDRAILSINTVMPRMDKPVELPPSVIEIREEQRAGERLLLWGLGLDPDRPAALAEPHVAVLFGRMRRLGPVLSGEGITQPSLFKILSYIGASCECGLDRSWMQGDMVPARWDELTAARAARSLGFDLESPMVKTEINQILAKTGSAIGKTREEGRAASPADLLSGYSESSADEFDDESFGAELTDEELARAAADLELELELAPELEIHRIAAAVEDSGAETTAENEPREDQSAPEAAGALINEERAAGGGPPVALDVALVVIFAAAALFAGVAYRRRSA